MVIDPPDPWPRPAVSSAIFRGEQVLLVLRARPPYAGRWSLPGGRIKPGERAREAALRELFEETGVTAQISGLAEIVDVIHTPKGVLSTHYVISVFFGTWLAGEPLAASDAADARFVPLRELADLSMTEGAASVIAKAWRLASCAVVAP